LEGTKLQKEGKKCRDKEVRDTVKRLVDKMGNEENDENTRNMNTQGTGHVFRAESPLKEITIQKELLEAFEGKTSVRSGSKSHIKSFSEHKNSITALGGGRSELGSGMIKTSTTPNSYQTILLRSRRHNRMQSREMFPVGSQNLIDQTMSSDKGYERHSSNKHRRCKTKFCEKETFNSIVQLN
jgi:hypothetical protein